MNNFLNQVASFILWLLVLIMVVVLPIYTIISEERKEPTDSIYESYYDGCTDVTTAC